MEIIDENGFRNNDDHLVSGCFVRNLSKNDSYFLGMIHIFYTFLFCECRLKTRKSVGA